MDLSNLFEKAKYDQTQRSYVLNGKRLRSVSSIVSDLKPIFDKEAVSKKVALKEGKTQEEVLKSWEDKANIGRDKGEKLHNYITHKISNEEDDLVAILEDKTLPMQAFDKIWKKLQQQCKAELVAQEFEVNDVEYGITGRLDALFKFTIGNKETFHLLDWKTGKFRSENRYEKLLNPFSDLDNAELITYSIQISLYRLMLERAINRRADDFSDFKIGDSYLVHLSDEGEARIHKALDLRSKLHDWLKAGETPELLIYIKSLNPAEFKNISAQSKRDILKALEDFIRSSGIGMDEEV